jgi:hypothetical protein
MLHKSRKYLIIIILLAGLGLILAACTAATPAATESPTQAPAPTCPAPAPCPTAVAGPEAPFQALWEASPHNDAASEAFVHWDEEEDKAVPTNCATCHSSTGYQDFLGADGSEAGVVDAPAPIGTTVNCTACHNDATANLTSVSFLSGVTINNLGPEARCMVCHQGRATKVTVDDLIAKFEATDADAVVEPIVDGETTTRFGFINVHYYAAAITLYGTEVKGGYEYEGKAYDAKNDHVEGYATCVGCHNPHSLEVKVDECAACHEGVATVEDLKAIRMVSSAPDYDGDGDVVEGMAGEIEGLQASLYAGIVAYAADNIGTGIVYDSAAHPYWFADADADGTADMADDANVAYATWTPRLLKAAYNYQVSLKDPGAYAHGNKYIIQLLFDSLEDVNSALSSPIEMGAMHRDDAGHFAGNTEPFRHWDGEEGNVPGSCAKCHAATGLPQFFTEGVNVTNKASNGFLCSTCHDGANFPATYTVDEVTFPSGAQVTFGEGAPANLCLACHQGRESTVSVDRALGPAELDTPSEANRFRNVHYFAAGATLFGTEVKGIYEYEGKTYLGRFMHEGNLNTCTSCHDPHVLAVNTEACAGCHQTDDPAEIRLNSTGDYDGDGDVTEGLKGEVDTYAEKLLAAIEAYSTGIAEVGIIYDSHAYPYWFIDADGDGEADVNAEGAATGYNAWTPRLLKAAYNYQYSQKDPGAYTHNGLYVMQALYDSIADLKTRVPTIDNAGMLRP